MLPSNDRSRRPTYELHEVQRLVGQGPISRTITQAAYDGAAEAGLTAEHIVSAVLQLDAANFYKSMPSDRIAGLWQDVYHLSFQQVEPYIKLQVHAVRGAVVIQFKRR